MRASARLAPAALALAAAAAHAAGDIGPGSYCPLPKENEVPKCLEPARAEYDEFFRGLEAGEPSDAQVAELEADLERAESERAYVALSSLAYGYYRLSRRAAATPEEDPTIAARLERWNALLARTYARSDDAAYRDAVRAAAVDLHERSPAVALDCVDASGETVECASTEAVLRGLDHASGRVGVRGALQRILRRITGGGDS